MYASDQSCGQCILPKPSAPSTCRLYTNSCLPVWGRGFARVRRFISPFRSSLCPNREFASKSLREVASPLFLAPVPFDHFSMPKNQSSNVDARSRLADAGEAPLLEILRRYITFPTKIVYSERLRDSKVNSVTIKKHRDLFRELRGLQKNLSFKKTTLAKVMRAIAEEKNRIGGSRTRMLRISPLELVNVSE